MMSGQVLAQDERFFRKLISGEFVHETEVKDVKKYSYILHSPEYLIDLNGDGKKESIVYFKRDSEDWIDIYDSDKKRIFKYKFEAKGSNAALYRVTKKKLDSNTDLLVLYYFEGETKYTSTDTSARIYLLTIDNQDFSKISVLKGPSIFEEFKSLKSHYHLKNYQVGIVDLNGDGKKEVEIKFRDISSVLIYEGNGKWKTFREHL
jgi:hypothetical protein